MLFTSGVIIAFFCFAFYLIWSQFLKKDTRLSAGLKVLRKKISDLQNLSSHVQIQVDKGMAEVTEKVHRLEYLLGKTTEVCDRIEHNLSKWAEFQKQAELQKEMGQQPPSQPVPKKAQKTKKNLSTMHLREVPSTKPNLSKTRPGHLNILSSQQHKKDRFSFGESPFVKLGFVEDDPPPPAL